MVRHVHRSKDTLCPPVYSRHTVPARTPCARSSPTHCAEGSYLPMPTHCADLCFIIFVVLLSLLSDTLCRSQRTKCECRSRNSYAIEDMNVLPNPRQLPGTYLPSLTCESVWRLLRVHVGRLRPFFLFGGDMGCSNVTRLLRAGRLPHPPGPPTCTWPSFI